MQVLSSEMTVAQQQMDHQRSPFLFTGICGAPLPRYAAFQRGVKLIGATSHYVTADLDDGPIIEQDVVRISHRSYQADDLFSHGLDIEKSVLHRAVAWHLYWRILCYGNKTVVFD